MVTKYDLFEVVYKNKNPIKPIEVVEDLNKTEKEYNNIHRLLTELEKNHFLIKTKKGSFVYHDHLNPTITGKIVVE